jgi:hypothetical protein
VTQVILWDPEEGVQTHCLPPVGGDITAMELVETVSPDLGTPGRYHLVITGENRPVQIWDVGGVPLREVGMRRAGRVG